MSDTGKDDGHFFRDDGHFFPDDGYFSFHVGQFLFHVEHKFSNDEPIVENVGHSHAMMDDFFMIWNNPAEMLDDPSGKPKEMLNVLPNILDKRNRLLNTR